MTEVYNLDRLGNGKAGALARMTEGLAQAGIGAEILGHWTETHRTRISGTIPDLPAYRAAIEAPADWVEACLTLPATTLSGRHGLPYVHALDRFLVGDGLNKPHEQSRLPARIEPPVLPDDARRFPAAVFIGGRGGATYGHWLLDFVPQILTAQETLRRRGEAAPILVVNHTPFGKRLLKFLGLAEGCLFAERDEPFHVERMYFPLITKLRTRYSIEMLRRSYGHMLALSAEGGRAARREGAQKILVARQRPPVAANFDALRVALEARGFTVISPEEFAYRKQFQLFHNAAIVVGEDGSAMHNAGFCRPGTPLIVWSRGDKVNWWHGPVAQAAELPLHYLQSRLREDGGYDAPIDEILALV